MNNILEYKDLSALVVYLAFSSYWWIFRPRDCAEAILLKHFKTAFERFGTVIFYAYELYTLYLIVDLVRFLII